MIRKLVIISVLFFVYACGSGDKEAKIPDNIISQKEMVLVLVDFHLADASILQGQQRHEDINEFSNYRFNSVLKKHKISRNQLKESFKFYSEHIKDLEKIYKEVVVELSTTQSRIISK